MELGRRPWTSVQYTEGPADGDVRRFQPKRGTLNQSQTLNGGVATEKTGHLTQSFRGSSSRKSPVSRTKIEVFGVEVVWLLEGVTRSSGCW